MRRRSRNNPLIISAYAGVLAVCIGGLGYAAYTTFGTKVPDKFGCYSESSQLQSIVLFDASGPRFNTEQGRSLRIYFDRLYNSLRFNERLSFITSEGDQISSVAAPRFHVCGGATSPAELEAIGAASAQPGYLKKQKEKLYQKILGPELDALLAENPDESRRQNQQSPILEMIADISRLPELKPGSRIIVVSDLIQSSDSVQFCRTKNDMPRFRLFKQRPEYARIKPNSLEGVEVEVLMLQRTGYGRLFYEFCSGEDELMAFWRDYFIENGAKPHFTRIRNGVIEG